MGLKLAVIEAGGFESNYHIITQEVKDRINGRMNIMVSSYKDAAWRQDNINKPIRGRMYGYPLEDFEASENVTEALYLKVKQEKDFEDAEDC